MALPSPAERFRALELTLRSLEIAITSLQFGAESQSVALAEARKGFADRSAAESEKFATQVTENAVLKQKVEDLTRRLDDQAAHFKVWDQRWWGLLAGVVIAIVTAFLRK